MRACSTLWLTLAAAAQTGQVGFWEARPRLQTARQEVGAAVWNGQVYVAGGLSVTGQSIASVERYDPNTRTWTRGVDLPTTLHHFGMAALDGKLYVVGGYVAGFRGTTACHAFDVAASAWNPIRALPQARGALVAVALGGRIYAVGGVDPTRGVVADLTVYDPAADLWLPLPPMPTPREHLAAAALDGKLYVAGGRSSAGNLDALEVYDPATNAWTVLPRMPTARGGNGGAALHGELIVVGGEGSRIFPEAEAFDPRTNTWRTLRMMTPGLHGIYPVTLGDEVFVGGGATVPGFGAVDLALAFRALPDGVARYGTATPACAGALVAGVDGLPVAGTGLPVSNWIGAPPQAAGVLALSAAPDPAGTLLLGARMHLDLRALVLAPVVASAAGHASFTVPLPRATAGGVFCAQFVFANPPPCQGTGPLSASDALAVRVR